MFVRWLVVVVALGGCQSPEPPVAPDQQARAVAADSSLATAPDTLGRRQIPACEALGALSVPDVFATVPGDGFDVCGYVIATHDCPPCPAEALCSPCAPFHSRISLAEDPSTLPRGRREAWSPERLDIDVRRPDEFDVGGLYVVTVEPIPFVVRRPDRPPYSAETIRAVSHRRL